jgi:2-keto-4-pentenoate hydratase/2-oxohepta-3-ene-1,7-dioic acid hydratase in catechol pathway
MRLITFSSNGTAPRAGALTANDTTVVDLQSAWKTTYNDTNPHFDNVLALIEGGDEALEQARNILQRASADTLLPRASVYLHAPLQPPPQMRACACFELHLAQSYAAARRFSVHDQPDPEAAYRALDTRADDRVIETFNSQPIYYKCNRFATVGNDDEVIWPNFSSVLDFELEWGCYISKKGKDISAANASDHIFGYTIYNDVSARDAQRLEMAGQLGPTKSKDFDTANVMGPCLVTRDEIGDPYDLDMVARVNGEEWGRGNTGSMRWTFEEVIQHVSQSETLYPGEFLASGCVGNGSGLERLRFLKPGDLVELEIAKLGVLRSRIVKPARSA